MAMKWIFEHFQVVVLIGFALASLVKRRQDMAQAAQDDEVPVPRPNRQIPQPEVPPPVARDLPQVVVRKTTPTPALVRSGQGAPAGLSGEALILKQQQDIQERLRQIRDATKATTTGGAAATRRRVSAAQRHPKAALTAKSSLRASLHSRQEIRRAIVLREILSPPVGLR